MKISTRILSVFYILCMYGLAGYMIFKGLWFFIFGLEGAVEHQIWYFNKLNDINKNET